MPVIKDLVVDMDAVHWKKIQRVTPWLINKEPIPEREYIVPHENMVDVTQSMACIQCGACVASCLSMEVDPLFVGPAALAKAYRFVGDPRDAQQYERLKRPRRGPARHVRLHALLQLHRGVPEGRRADEPDHAAAARSPATTTTSSTATTATATSARSSTLVKGYGLLHEAELLPRSYGGDSWFGKFAPAAGARAARLAAGHHQARCVRRKVTPKGALLGHKIPKDDLKDVQRIFETVEGKDERYELNLYITGYDEDDGDVRATPAATAGRRPARTRGLPDPMRGRLLARLREPRVHARAARLDGEGRAAARHRARRARPRATAAAPASSPSTTRSSPTR